MNLKLRRLILGVNLFLVAVCSPTYAQHKAQNTPVSKESVSPGSLVVMEGKTFHLYDGDIQVGQNFFELTKDMDIKFPVNNKVMIINIVPSIDTPVCGIQTYRLGSMVSGNEHFDVLTVSRDLPMAQERWAKGHGFTKENFASDYKTGSFGKTTGLMMKDIELLARGIIVVDKSGIIRYLQIVPEISYLPDLVTAVDIANKLVNE